MEIKKCENRLDWEKHLGLAQSNPIGSAQGRHKTLDKAEFLQSWDWGEFQVATGKQVLRLQMVENGSVVGQMQGFVHELGLGIKYLYLPRVKVEDSRFKIIVDFLKKDNFSFVRIELIDEFNLESSAYNLKLTKNRQPSTTLLLDLTQSEDVLLQSMHSKTRYNIRLAKKKGVEVKLAKDTDAFWGLNEETVSRDKFKSHDKEYYAKMLDNNFCHQLTAYHNYKPIASNIFIVYGDTCTYLHGTSSNEQRNLMAPYLLQWEAIIMAKKLGCKYYDFWGIAPVMKEGEGKVTCFNNFCWQADHAWTGITRFKTGFGGSTREYPHAVDIVLNKFKYFIYKLARKVRGLN